MTVIYCHPIQRWNMSSIANCLLILRFLADNTTETTYFLSVRAGGDGVTVLSPFDTNKNGVPHALVVFPMFIYTPIVL